MDWVSYLSGVAATPVVIGLSVWFGKVWAARILEKDKARYRAEVETLLAELRVRGDKELLVHRLQFEAEYAIYRDLWKTARSLANACVDLRELEIQNGPPFKRDELNEALVRAHEDFREVVMANQPFYADKVYEASEALLLAAVSLNSIQREAQGVERDVPQTAARLLLTHVEPQIDRLDELDGETRKVVLVEIPKALPRLRDAIRARIWSTGASGWDRANPPTEQSA